MAITTLRENTFKVDLSDFDKRPSYEHIHDFIYNTIGLRPQQVIRLQMNHVQFCAHVKCTDLRTAQYAVQQHNGQHEIKIDGKTHKIQLMMDDGSIDVKVYDLSENISNDKITSFLRQYGEVHSIREIMWSKNFAFKGIPTGVRVAQMTLQRHIKSYITIQGEQTLVTYKDQPQTCRHCTHFLHSGVTCVENKKLQKQQSGKNNSTNENPTTGTANVLFTETNKSTQLNSKPAATTQSAAHQKDTPAASTVHTKATNEYQQQPRQQPKRTADRSDNATVKSPPRKKLDSTTRRATTESASHVENECSTDESTEMETVSEHELESEEEPQDSDKWLIWVLKKHKRNQNYCNK